MQSRFLLYLAFAAFFAFSIGLNIGLLGFHNFHFEVSANNNNKINNKVITTSSGEYML